MEVLTESSQATRSRSWVAAVRAFAAAERWAATTVGSGLALVSELPRAQPATPAAAIAATSAAPSTTGGAPRRFARVPSGSRRVTGAAGASRTRGRGGFVRARAPGPDGPRARPRRLPPPDGRDPGPPWWRWPTSGWTTYRRRRARPPRGAGSDQTERLRWRGARPVPVPGPPPSSARLRTSAVRPGSPTGPSSARCPAASADRAGPR